MSRVTTSSASFHWARLVARSTPNPPSSASELDSPVPNSTRPSDTRSRVAIRSATRAGWLKPTGSWTMPCPSRMRRRPLAGGSQEDLGRRRVGVLLEEVVLHLPDVVEAQPVGQLDLVEGVLEQDVLVVGTPRTGQLVFVEDPEPHGGPLPFLVLDHGVHQAFDAGPGRVRRAAAA